MLIYNKLWNEIDEQDWPAPGVTYVCKDTQRRCGINTWVVSTMGDGTLSGDTIVRGLFWHKQDAILFADKWELKLRARKLATRAYEMFHTMEQDADVTEAMGMCKAVLKLTGDGQ